MGCIMADLYCIHEGWGEKADLCVKLTKRNVRTALQEAFLNYQECICEDKLFLLISR